MRLPHIAIVIVLAIAAVQIAYYYPQVPNVVAGHFGVTGAPDSWQPKSAFFGLFAFIYVLFAAMFWALPNLIMTLPPSLINMPNKDYWLAPERRASTSHIVGDQLSWLGVVVLAFLVLFCQLAINANLPGSSGALAPAFWWVFGILLTFTIAWTVRFYRIFRVSR